MNYVKLFVTVFTMAIAMNAGAQSKTTAKSKTVATPAKTTTTAAPAKKTATTTTATTTKKTTSSSKSSSKSSKTGNRDYDPGCHLLLETKFGKFYGPHVGLGENIVLEKEFHKYVAVDFFSIDYATNLDGCDWHAIGIKTGAKAFSPRWWGGRMRAYSSLALGYECGITSASRVAAADSWGSWSSWSGTRTYNAKTIHAFALSWGLGISIVDHYNLGYALEYNSNGGWGTAHYFKFGYRF